MLGKNISNLFIRNTT